MVLGVREKGQVHSRSQWTSTRRRQQELGSARLLVMFYQTWGALLFASASASPFYARAFTHSTPRTRFFLNLQKSFRLLGLCRSALLCT